MKKIYTCLEEEKLFSILKIVVCTTLKNLTWVSSSKRISGPLEPSWASLLDATKCSGVNPSPEIF